MTKDFHPMNQKNGGKKCLVWSSLLSFRVAHNCYATTLNNLWSSSWNCRVGKIFTETENWQQKNHVGGLQQRQGIQRQLGAEFVVPSSFFLSLILWITSPHEKVIKWHLFCSRRDIGWKDHHLTKEMMIIFFSFHLKKLRTWEMEP